MASSWGRKLARPIALKGSHKKLVTLRDAGDYLQFRFTAATRHPMLEAAIADLLKAAESGKAEDRLAATDQVERLLEREGLATSQAPRPLSEIERRMLAMHRPARSVKSKKRDHR